MAAHDPKGKELTRPFAGWQNRGCGFSEGRRVTDRPNELGPIKLGYGSITVRALREFYGSFAPHLAESKKLSEVLDEMDVASLSQLIRDFKSGKLAKICQNRRATGTWHSRPSQNRCPRRGRSIQPR